MSGERASTTRMGESGKICAMCRAPLPEPHTYGEKRCAKCDGTHRVYMSFFLSHRWYCQFLESDLKTPLPKKVTLNSPEKIIELAARGHAFSNLESRQQVDHAIANGRGGIWLELTEEQYLKLK